MQPAIFCGPFKILLVFVYCVLETCELQILQTKLEKSEKQGLSNNAQQLNFGRCMNLSCCILAQRPKMAVSSDPLMKYDITYIYNLYIT